MTLSFRQSRAEFPRTFTEEPRHILRAKWERHGVRVSGLSNILINTSLPERRGGRPARETQKAMPPSRLHPTLFLFYCAYGRRLVLACQEEGGLSLRNLKDCLTVRGVYDYAGLGPVDRSVKNMFTRYHLAFHLCLSASLPPLPLRSDALFLSFSPRLFPLGNRVSRFCFPRARCYRTTRPIA